MSRWRKLLERFLFRPETIDIAEIRLLLKRLGYQEKTGRGSHCIFRKDGSYPVCVPTVSGRHVKKEYVKRLSVILNLEEKYERAKGEEDD